ncbi:MAG: acylneuraminate cytidylyltransferase family protein [Anaerolineales bacterium]|jgi:CMP-N-acetylneuraminic acid synthetase
MNILGVIPARGGSKSVPRKNIALVHGKPLLAYTIQAAQGSQRITHFVVSSEDPEIVAVAKRYGAPVPFERPAELAADESPTLPVVQHALREMEMLEGIAFDYIVLLQPTTPLRLPEDIDAAVDKLIATGADSVISVCDVGAYHPARMRQIVDDRLVELPIREPKEMLRRQDLPPVYIRNGAVYAVKREVVIEHNSMVGQVSRPYIMPDERSINVDSKLDLLLAEILLSPQHQSG